jgi:branched-chain amino acid transport system substrate-binding protein
MTRRPRLLTTGLLCIAGVVLTACSGGPPGSGSSFGSSPASGSAANGSLVFAQFNPFSGPDAAFGPEMVVACDAAANLINASGGILGHKTACKSFDTHGDPADAVAAASQMIATTSNLVGALGPSSDEALATVPILNRAHIPMFADTGQAAFDHTTSAYFWRLSPADDVKGFAMAAWARKQGYTRAAAIFGNDVGSQSDVPTLVHAFSVLGGTTVSNQAIALDQPSYRTEVERMLAAKPQVIFTEEDPATAATFLSEVAQLNGGKLIPVVGTETTLEASWVQAVVRAIGSKLLRQYQVGVQPFAPPSGPAYTPFRSALDASKAASAANLAVYSTDPYAMGYYDSINIMALAMIAAKSTVPGKYNSDIPAVSNPGSGKVVVTTFVAGKKALESGKQIQYIGASGPAVFNKWHNSTGAFEIAGYLAPGKIRLAGEVTAAQIAAISSR